MAHTLIDGSWYTRRIAVVLSEAQEAGENGSGSADDRLVAVHPEFTLRRDFPRRLFRMARNLRVIHRPMAANSRVCIVGIPYTCHPADLIRK